MAMNDISVSISADKESFLAFKDSSLADSADESGTEFFTQLQDAHTTFEPTKKEINKPETDTLSAASADSSSVTNEKLNSDSDDEDIAQINLSGSDILEQINSSQLMNTEVTKPSEKAKDIKLENLVMIESKSLSESCKSLDIIKSHGVDQAGSCSKYSLGIVYSGLAEKWSKFEKTMKKIKEIRMEVVKQKRNTSTKSVEKQLSHHFKKTSLKKVNETV